MTITLLIDLSILDKFLSTQRIKTPVPELSATENPISKLKSIKSIVVLFQAIPFPSCPTLYKSPLLPHSVQIQTTAMLLERGPLLHQSQGGGLEM